MNYFVFDHHNFWQWGPSTSDLMNAEVVFIWADWCFRDNIQTLQKLGKKIIVYEHGFGALWDYELNHREPMANGYLALGKASKNSLIRVGVSSGEVLVTGNPVYDDIKATKHEGKNALFVALHWIDDRSEYNQILFDQLVRAYPDLNWTVKLIDKTGDIITDKRKWFNKVESDSILEDIKNKLPEYDMVFTPRSSTFESFARLMGIPVYVVDEHETYKREGEPDRVPMDYTFIKIGEELPGRDKIVMGDYIKRPSLDIDLILDWIKTL